MDKNYNTEFIVEKLLNTNHDTPFILNSTNLSMEELNEIISSLKVNNKLNDAGHAIATKYELYYSRVLEAEKHFEEVKKIKGNIKYYNLRGLMDYCEQKNIKASELSPEEQKLFIKFN